MDKSNGDFIYQLCQLCGELTEFPSTMILNAGFDSRHDTERIVLHVCGNCTDRIFDSLIAKGMKVDEMFNP